jgi:hypothetical protein
MAKRNATESDGKRIKSLKHKDKSCLKEVAER